MPDEPTILNFRHLLEAHQLAASLFQEVVSLLTERGLILREATIVDATLIAAPPSTKNEARKRDPEMTSSKKGNQWHFGMKAHIGVDTAHGDCGYADKTRAPTVRAPTVRARRTTSALAGSCRSNARKAATQRRTRSV